MNMLNVTGGNISPDEMSHPIISDETLSVFYLGLGVTEAISGSLGLAFNVFNTVVFLRLGLTDTTNISLLGLAVADIGVSLTMIGYAVIYNPTILWSAAYTDTIDAVNYVVLGTPHVLFSRIAGLLTAFISLERFLCIAWPLHIKSMVTPRRTTVVVISIYTFMVFSTIPTFMANQIGPRFNPELNKTVVGLIFPPHGEELENATITINVIVQMMSFVVVTASTLFLVRSLHKMTKWRSSSRLVKVNNESGRDKQLVKTIVLISSVFIVCSLPTVVVNALMPFFKEYNLKGREKNMFIVTCGVFFMLQLINGTVNIFIYFTMSSRFRETFLVLFCHRTKVEEKT